MLLISRKEAEKLLDMGKLLKAVEGAFQNYAQGKAQMPPKLYLDLPKYQGDFRAMPAAVGDAAGIKWVNSHPGNPGKFGLPTVMAVMILNDPKDGRPLAIMDATFITKYRTAAASAVASKYLARTDSTTLGIIGCGAQAEPHIRALREVFDFREIRLSDLNREQAENLAAKFPAGLCHFASAPEAAAADIVCTLTPGRAVALKEEWVKPGTHINAVGADAPEKSELEPEILQKARIFVDDWEQASHSGEISLPLEKGILKPEDVAGSLAQVVAGTKEGRQNSEEITLFDSTGLAIEDIVAAAFLFEEARRQGLGTEVELI